MALKVPPHIESACCSDPEYCAKHQVCMLRAQYAASHPELFDANIGAPPTTPVPKILERNVVTREVVERGPEKEDITVPSIVPPATSGSVSNKKKTTSFRGLK